MCSIPMQLLLLLLALVATSTTATTILRDAAGQSGQLQSVGSLSFGGNLLKRFRSADGDEIVEPHLSLNLRSKSSIRRNVFGSGFYFSLPVEVDSTLNGSLTNSSTVLQPKSLEASFRKSVISNWCSKNCTSIAASGFRNAAGQFKVMIRCSRRALCKQVFDLLYFRSPDSELVNSAFKFVVTGIAKGQRYSLTRFGLPVQRPVAQPLSGEYWFEGDKVLLYTVRAGSGHSAYSTFLHSYGYRMPADGSWPAVYRSHLLDNLQKALRSSKQWTIVAEMRTNGKMVAQVVFDASKGRSSLTSTNWFSAARVKSSFPFQIPQSGYNFFSVAGDSGIGRSFFINYRYEGCEKDQGLWVVSDKKDVCPWGNGGWRGRAPVLAYNTAANLPYQSGSVRYADQFVVYLRYSLPSLPAVAANPFRNDFEFEKGKLLLFTVKAHSNVMAYPAFATPKAYSIPADGSLPTVYRSGFLENLPTALAHSGKRRIVAEMRNEAGKAVARVVFQPTDQSYDKFSWFAAKNIVSSFPQKLSRTGKYNFFSVAGHHDHWVVRRFLINFFYAGCPADAGFWAVLEKNDVCPWANRGWTGRAPQLVYSVSSKPYGSGTARFADRFLIYLQ